MTFLALAISALVVSTPARFHGAMNLHHYQWKPILDLFSSDCLAISEQPIQQFE